MKISLLFKHEKDALEKLREAKRFFFENDNSHIGMLRREIDRLKRGKFAISDAEKHIIENHKKAQEEIFTVMGLPPEVFGVRYFSGIDPIRTRGKSRSWRQGKKD